jgi:hypothetical protein
MIGEENSQFINPTVYWLLFSICGHNKIEGTDKKIFS